jgi:pimeloyl-ACP methyl ester carboxylesterase
MFAPGTDTALINSTAADMSSAPPEIAVNALMYVLGYDYRTALAEMRLPIRTISGDNFATNVELNQEIAESFEVRLMPGQGHFLQFENPTMFDSLLIVTISEFWPDAEMTPDETKETKETEETE